MRLPPGRQTGHPCVTGILRAGTLDAAGRRPDGCGRSDPHASRIAPLGPQKLLVDCGPCPPCPARSGRPARRVPSSRPGPGAANPCTHGSPTLGVSSGWMRARVPPPAGEGAGGCAPHRTPARPMLLVTRSGPGAPKALRRAGRHWSRQPTSGPGASRSACPPPEAGRVCRLARWGRRGDRTVRRLCPGGMARTHDGDPAPEGALAVEARRAGREPQARGEAGGPPVEDAGSARR